jgi:hypothetical protein
MLAFHIVESDSKAMGGKATLKRVAVSFQLQGEPFIFHLTLFVPNARRGKAPVFLLLNHRSPENTDPTRKTQMEFWPAEYVIERGYAIAAINVAAEVEPDNAKATTGVRAFYRKYYARPDELTWGALSAWAWSGSRAVDYFETDPDIDTAQIAVIGHSRGGKTSLWADPRGSWLALIEASKVWVLYGGEAVKNKMPLVNDLLICGPMAYHIREGGHGLTLFDWKLYLDHADSLFKKRM